MIAVNLKRLSVQKKYATLKLMFKSINNHSNRVSRAVLVLAVLGFCRTKNLSPTQPKIRVSINVGFVFTMVAWFGQACAAQMERYEFGCEKGKPKVYCNA